MNNNTEKEQQPMHTEQPSESALDLPLTANDLRSIAQQGLLQDGGYEKALSFLGIRPQAKDWAIFWRRILLVTGVLFSVAGIICFFAWNWADMSHFTKFALLVALMLVSAAIPLIRSMDSVAGKLGLLACGLLAGPLLAVFGQYYQTGADAWELFRAWALFLIFLAILGRQSGLWAAAWLVSSLWGALYINQVLIVERWSSLFQATELPEFIIVQVLILLCWEAAMFRARRRPDSFLHADWFIRVLAISILWILTGAMSSLISSRYSFKLLKASSMLPVEPVLTGLYVLFMAGGYYWYREKRPDTFILTAQCGSLIFLFFDWLLTNFRMNSMNGMLFMALLLVACAYGVGKLIMHWHKSILIKERIRISLPNMRGLFFLKQYTCQELFHRLGIADSSTLNIQNKEKAPWYVRLMLTVCAWFSAAFFIMFLGYCIKLIGRENDKIIFLVGSIVFLTIACFFTRKEALFRQQFGLTLALAGCLSLVFSLYLLTDEWLEGWRLFVIFSAGLGFVLIRNGSFRCIAAAAIVLASLDGMGYLLSFILEPNYWYLRVLSTVFFGVLGILLAHAWHTEKDWVGNEKKDRIIRPILNGFIISFLLSGLLFTLMGKIGPRYFNTLITLLSACGLGAGIGFGYFVWCINEGQLNKDKGLIYLGAAVALISGWWLPWLPVAVFMLALARFLGNLAMVGLSVAFLAFSVNWYYYNLKTSLLHKSVTLCIAGVIMILFGIFIHKFFLPGLPQDAHKEESHA